MFVDFHAEATSEKQALGVYLDGRVSGVVGTHTHVRPPITASCRRGRLPDRRRNDRPYEGVIGFRSDRVLQRFHPDAGRIRGRQARRAARRRVIDIDETTGRARAIDRFLVPDGGA